MTIHAPRECKRKCTNKLYQKERTKKMLNLFDLITYLIIITIAIDVVKELKGEAE